MRRETFPVQVGVLLLTALGAGCTLDRRAIPPNDLTARPAALCPGESSRLRWSLYNDYRCGDTCPRFGSLGPAVTVAERSPSGEVTVSPAATTDYEFRGQECREGSCRDVTLGARVEVVEGDGVLSFVFEGHCGPRWSGLPLSSLLSPCLTVKEVCVEYPAQVILAGTLDGTTTVSEPLGTGAQCTTVFSGKAQDLEVRNVLLLDPTRYGCGTVEGASEEEAPDIPVRVTAVCESPCP